MMFKIIFFFFGAIILQTLAQSCRDREYREASSCFQSAVRSIVGEKRPPKPDHDEIRRSIGSCVNQHCTRDAVALFRKMHGEDGDGSGMGGEMMGKLKKCHEELMEDRTIVPVMEKCMSKTFPGWTKPDMPAEVEQIFHQGHGHGDMPRKMMGMMMCAEMAYDENLCPKGPDGLMDCIDDVMSKATGNKECKTPVEKAFEMAELKSEVCDAHKECLLSVSNRGCRSDLENMHQTMCNCGFETIQSTEVQKKVQDCMKLPIEVPKFMISSLLGKMQEKMCNGPSPCAPLEKRIAYKAEMKAEIETSLSSNSEGSSPLARLLGNNRASARANSNSNAGGRFGEGGPLAGLFGNIGG